MDEHTPVLEQGPLACTLQGRDYARRVDEISELLAARLETRELADGFALRYPGDAHRAEQLLAYIVTERLCCPFYTFLLRFEAHGADIWLEIRGPEGSKELLAPQLLGGGH